ncbi:MAG: triose-phosphate isomerase [Planctomycetota bacterium]
MRKPLIVGNWKMNQSLRELHSFFKELGAWRWSEALDAGICPAFPHLAEALRLKGNLPLWIGAQDCHEADNGAHTGDVSAAQLKDLGILHVLAGHSERRSNHHESSSLVNRKAAKALSLGLSPIICVGETLEERKAGRALEVVTQQIRESLAGLKPVVVAYEPVWAIGTGVNATPDQAQEMHQHIRSLVEGWGGSPETQRILYGGSVKPETTAALMACPDIDGLLVGGASLKAASFAAILDAAQLQLQKG